MTLARNVASRALTGVNVVVVVQDADDDAQGATESQLVALGAPSGHCLRSGQNNA